jgi:outer membrane protein assembly factor BamB
MSRWGRALVVLTSLGGACAVVWSLGGPMARGQVILRKGGVPLARPMDAGAAREGEFADALTLPTDRKARKSLQAAEDYINEAAWDQATHVLQLLLNGKEDMFVEVKRTDHGKEVSQWTSIRFEANRLLGTMPAEGLQMYEVQFGGKARDLLDEARKAPEQRRSDDLKNQTTIEILAHVAQSYLHTRAGSQAAEMLGTYYLDRGQPVMATLCFERLLGSRSSAVSPQMLLKAALAFRRLGDQANADLAWKRLAKSSPRGLALGDRTVPLEDVQREIERLPKGEALVNAYDWPVFKGNPSRSAQGIGGTPFLDGHRWEKTTYPTTTPDVKALVEEGVKGQQERQQAILPALFPIAAGGKLIFRTYQGVRALDIQTGELAWDQVASWSLEQLLMDHNYRVQINQWKVQYTQQIKALNVLYENSTLGTLSTDHNLVFAVDDLGMPPPQYLAQQMAMNGGQMAYGKLADPVNCNQLMAIELESGKLKWQVGGRGDKEPLQDCYFLGAPLPLGGKLYVLIEKNSELRLVCLQAATGELSWSQTLAAVRDRMVNDIGRRIQAANLAYGDGILVCPTNAGAIIGVDLLTHSLAWAKPYRETPPIPEPVQPNMRFGRGMPIRGMMDPAHFAHQLQPDWKCSAPVIQDGKVVFTAPDGASIYCLNLRDGSPVWKASRNEDLYLADAKQVWHQEVGTPSGYGTASNGIYYLPLKASAQGKDPEVCALDIDSGRIVAHAKSIGSQGHEKPVPGNLVFYENRVLSQTVDRVTAYPLLGLVLAEMSELLKKNPNDPVGLTKRAEMRRHNGEVAGAVEDLHRAMQNKPDEATQTKARELLFDSLTELFQKDFNASEKYLDEYREMCKVPVAENATPDQRRHAEDEQQRRHANFLCLVAKGKEAQGKLLEAFRYYQEFGGLRDRTGLLTVIDEPSVKAAPDLWAQGRMAALMAKATPEQRKPLEDDIAQQWQEVQATGDAARLRTFVTLFGPFSHWGKEARLRLAERLLEENAFVDAELQLLQVYRQDDMQLAARAVEMLARLCTRKELLEDAAYWYRLLGTRYAQIPIRDGKTGADIYDELATDKRFLPYLDDAPAAWNRGTFKGKTERSTTANMQMCTLYEPDGERLPFHRRNRLGVMTSPFQKLVLKDRDTGEERWSHSLANANVNRAPMMMNNGFNPVPVNSPQMPRQIYGVQGHYAVLQWYNNVYAIDLAQQQLLWERSLSGTEAAAGIQGNVLPNPRGGINIYTDGRQEKIGQAGPVEPAFVCVHSRQGLFALDPLKGTVLWTRTDVPGSSVVFGDRDFLYVMEVSPNGTLSGGRAFRAHDGANVDVADFVEVYKNKIAMLGRHIVAAETTPGGGKRLRLYDINAGKDLWSQDFSAGAIVLHSEEPGLAGVVEPKEGGRLTVIDLRTRREVLRAAIDPSPLKDITTGHLLRDQDQVYVGLHNANQAGNANSNWINLQGGLRGIMVNGFWFAFRRDTGKLAWMRDDVQNMALILDRFQDLPILLFSVLNNQMVVNVNRNFQQSATVKSVHKRTGKLVYENTFPGQQGQVLPQFYALQIDVSAGTIDLVAQQIKVQHHLEK